MVSHLDLPGISEKWHKQMLSHQKDAVWRVVQDRTALLAHEVGFGKTAVMGNIRHGITPHGAIPVRIST